MKGGLIFEITISRKIFYSFLFVIFKDYTSNKWLSIVTDRSSGAASITNDTLEVMIHRRLLGTHSGPENLKKVQEKNPREIK